MPMVCLECKQLFPASMKEIERGNAKYCSISCVTKARNKTMIRIGGRVTLVCSGCGSQYSVKKCRAKTTKFCSKACKDTNNVTTGSYRTREQAFKTLPNMCAHCDETNDLVLHHINGDHFDNAPENWRIVCRSCHVKVEHPEVILNRIEI